MDLYGISETTILSIIENQIGVSDVREGQHEIVAKEVVTKHGYPIKVVFSREEKEIIIITAYPLKRGLRK